MRCEYQRKQAPPQKKLLQVRANLCLIAELAPLRGEPMLSIVFQFEIGPNRGISLYSS